jgi:hypothetical protein
MVIPQYKVDREADLLVLERHHTSTRAGRGLYAG